MAEPADGLTGLYPHQLVYSEANDTLERIEALRYYWRVSRAAIIRAAVRRGLPALERQQRRGIGWRNINA